MDSMVHMQQQDQMGRVIPDNIWEKWGFAAYRGYQAVPHDLFKFQAQLDLSNGELVTLLNILDFWWEADKNPFPGVSALAKRMNTNPRSVQRHLKVLEDKGFAIRERGNDEKRRFNLDGLVSRLAKLVKQEVLST
jgi:DNA-binding transcriptional ArsR family regulator